MTGLRLPHGLIRLTGIPAIRHLTPLISVSTRCYHEARRYQDPRKCAVNAAEFVALSMSE
jgi:hypothetical protein